jgi:transcriptional regulator with XRE-family HTH domain
MDMRKLVGRNFARLRLAKGFTQERFAELSGFTQQYVSGLERGRRNPTVVTLYHLAQALGVSHVDLVMPDQESRKCKAAETESRKIVRLRRSGAVVGFFKPAGANCGAAVPTNECDEESQQLCCPVCYGDRPEALSCASMHDAT